MGRKEGCRSLWRMALLAASILSSYFLLIEGQVTIAPLQIQVEPKRPIEGQNVTLTPKYTLTEARVCRWFRGRTTETNRLILAYFFPGERPGPASTHRETAGPGCTLHIRNLISEDTGNYTVNVESLQLNEQGYASVVVTEPVTNVTISGTEKAIEHGVTVLNCSSEGTNVSYYWLKENQSLVIPGIPENIFLINNNQTLIFNPTMREDSGNYTCYGYNSLSEVSANYSLNVSYGPDVPIIKPHDTPKYLAEGTAYNLSCEAVSNPSAQYTWFINTSVEIGNQSQLLLSDLNINNTGSYSCKAFNSETNHSRFSLMPMEIYVQKILSDPILESTAIGMVEENTNVTLNCRTSNSTDVRVFWFKDGHSLSPAAGLLDNNRTLVLVHVTKTDTGSYRCNASNNVSQPKSNLVNINVTYGPDEIKLNPEGTIEKTLNSDLKLECTGDSYPPAEFQWLFNNITQDVTGNILRVRLSNWTYEGNYSCKATNPFTNRTALRTTYVKLTEGSNGDDPGLSSGVIAGIVIGCLVGVVLVSGLLYYICAKTSLGRMEQHASNGNIPSAPGHNEGVTDTKPKAAEEDIQYSILAFKGNKGSPPPQPTLEASQPSDGMTIYSEIKKK